MTQSRTVYIHTDNGITLHAREFGSGGTTCLLIHGFADGEYVWQDLAPELATLCRTITVDLRGHGRSGWPAAANGYSLEAHLRDMRHVVRAFRARPLVVVGHSLGGHIALEMAATQPDLVAGLVIVDFGPDRTAAGAQQMLTNLTESLRGYDSIDDYRVWLEKARPMTPTAMLSHVAAESLCPSPHGGFVLRLDPRLASLPDDDETGNSDARVWDLLKRIQCPTLLLRGHGSAILSSRVAVRMLRALRKGSLSVIPEAGHAVPTDNPIEFVKAVRGFVARLLGMEPELRQQYRSTSA
jgi:pimeloyl-ACP methyl ester carboxylesterase